MYTNYAVFGHLKKLNEKTQKSLKNFGLQPRNYQNSTIFSD
jgi:hypothetical protein